MGGTGELEVRGRLVANMTGPWAPLLARGLGHPAGERYGLSKGCHIVTRPLTRSGALAIATAHKREGLSRGGRHFFIIPWRGRSLIGTTNVPYAGDPAAVGVTVEDVADFVAEINAAYPAARLAGGDVEHAIAGLYPLIDTDVRADVYQGASKVQIHDHAKDGIAGLVTVIGAKYTTARRLAEQAIDLAFRKLGATPPPAHTADTPVAGGRMERFRAVLAEALRRNAAGPALGADVVRELVQSYGADYPMVLALVEREPAEGQRVAPERPTIRAMVRHAVRAEMALGLSDVVFRRTGLGTIGHPGGDCLRECATIMAEELSWDARRTEAELERTRAAFPIQPASA
jgi:glycerol-3-phosphate dehydrogenase